MIVHFSKWLFWACDICASSAAGRERIDSISRDAVFAQKLDALAASLRSLNSTDASKPGSVNPQAMRDALSHILAG